MSALADAVLAGDRTQLAQAITLVESTRPDHVSEARDLLAALMPHTGAAVRVGITGVPGVGKSTFIDQLGMNLIREGRRVAVLAVDPSSSRTGGAILGDKTRMTRLAVDDSAFVRPSPTSGSLGGVTRTTREVMLVCEAAGFDVIIVETVGVGQSETVVADMVDTFVVLMLAGAGDELQGIKKGVLELADIVAVNKADGDNQTRAKLAATDLRRALQLVGGQGWKVPVLTCSGATDDGLDEVWQKIVLHRNTLQETDAFDQRRRQQQVRWMWSMLADKLVDDFRASAVERIHEMERAVAAGELPASTAVDRLLGSA